MKSMQKILSIVAGIVCLLSFWEHNLKDTRGHQTKGNINEDGLHFDYKINCSAWRLASNSRYFKKNKWLISDDYLLN